MDLAGLEKKDPATSVSCLAYLGFGSWDDQDIGDNNRSVDEAILSIKVV